MTSTQKDQYNPDAEHRVYCGFEAVNAKCPDHSVHAENAADRLYPDWTRRVLTEVERDTIDHEADLEYLNCEGH